MKDEREDVFFDHGLSEAVFAFDEAELIFAVCLDEFLLAVDDGIIFAEDAPDEFFFSGGDVFQGEVFLDIFEFLDHLSVDFERGCAVLSFVLEFDIFVEVFEREQFGHL